MELLKEVDFSWHAEQPDVPKMSAAQMKSFFDAPTRTLMDKINEVITGFDALIKDLQAAHNEQNGYLREHLEAIMALQVSQEALKGEDIKLDTRVSWATETVQQLSESLAQVGHELSALSGDLENWKLMEYTELKNVVEGNSESIGDLLQAEAVQDERMDHIGHDVSTLRGEYEDWRLMEYEALKARLAQLEDLLQNIGGGAAGGGDAGGAQGISGEVAIEDLPVGVSYAEGNVSLSYLVDGEMGVYHTLGVETGSCIFKTIGQVTDDSLGETVDGAITVYIIPRNHILTHPDYGYNGTLFMTKITPRYDMYGLQYSLSEIKYNIEVADRISDDPNYAAAHPNHVPSIGALISYLKSKAETWTFELEDGTTVEKSVVLG